MSCYLCGVHVKNYKRHLNKHFNRGKNLFLCGSDRFNGYWIAPVLTFLPPVLGNIVCEYYFPCRKIFNNPEPMKIKERDGKRSITFHDKDVFVFYVEVDQIWLDISVMFDIVCFSDLHSCFSLEYSTKKDYDNSLYDKKLKQENNLLNRVRRLYI